jgi:hypothetical protein
MNKHYTLIFLSSFTLLMVAGCSKDFLKPYEDRIEGGTWELHDIDRRGIGSSYDPQFNGGRFNFYDGGELYYVDQAGNEYEGSWNIRKYDSEQGRVRTLTITAIDFQNQRVLTENFDDMEFTGTDRFRAYVYSGGKTTVFRFKR